MVNNGEDNPDHALEGAAGKSRGLPDGVGQNCETVQTVVVRHIDLLGAPVAEFD